MAKQRREDQVMLYEEASRIASALGIIGRVDATNILQNIQKNVDFATATATTPLYYLGYDALITEINVLRSRKSDDPFIPGLRDLQEELGMLGSRDSDDPYIFGLRDLQVQLALLRSIKLEDRFVTGLRI